MSGQITKLWDAYWANHREVPQSTRLEVAAFIQSLPPEEQAQGLDELLRNNFPDTFLEANARVDPSVETSVEAFERGTGAAFDSERRIDDRELAALQAHFQRLSAAGQREALRFLFENAYAYTFFRCVPLAKQDPAPTLSPDSFMNGVYRAFWAPPGTYFEEAKELAFGLVPEGERAEVLGRLLTDNRPNTYQRCVQSEAADGLPVSLEALRQGLEAAIRSKGEHWDERNGIDPYEAWMLKDACARLPDEEQPLGQALLAREGIL